jgi:hypothetical protein
VAKLPVLVDTDVFIDYLNTGLFFSVLENREFVIHYSVVTRKELLSKQGLRAAERQSIRRILRRHRLVRLDNRIADVYSRLRRDHPSLEKEDCLIVATALVRDLPLLTRNWRHFRAVKGLHLFRV